MGIEDLEKDRAICEEQEIRYVHVMIHPDYPGELECGCDCAGHMEGDLDAAIGRDRAMKNAAARRRRWPARAAWRLSKNGNPCIRYSHYLVTIFPKSGQWSGSIARADGPTIFARNLYPTQQAAQLASFDAITFLDARQEKARQGAGTDREKAGGG